MVKKLALEPLIEELMSLPDPRINRTRKHLLLDIIILTVLAVLCGADSWVEVERFGRAKLPFLRRLLELPAGIPSHDTIGRVFRLLDAEALCRAFAAWTARIATMRVGGQIAIDGKTLRRSLDSAGGRGPIHMVNAWANACGLSLACRATAGKGNEISAIPAVLELLDVRGCVVSIDAIGCQRALAEHIVRRGGDYLLALKDNHPTLAAEVRDYFDDALAHGFAGPGGEHYEVDGGHGRVESRRVRSSGDVAWMADRAKWRALRSLVMVERRRELPGKEASLERVYYLSSLPADDARRFAELVRGHWGIENRLHWVLDVAFREDDCRVRAQHAAENFAVIRQMALNLLRSDTTTKSSLKGKRQMAGWDNEFLEKLLFN